MRYAIALLAGIVLYTLTATPILKWRARSQRERFCKHLVSGNGAEALKLIPKGAQGREHLEYFINQNWPISECRDKGGPGVANDPLLWECWMRRHVLHIGLAKPVYSEEGYALEPTLGFVYSCNRLTQYTGILIAGGAIDVFIKTHTGRAILRTDPLTAHKPAAKESKSD